MRRITSSIRVNDNLVLRPASTIYAPGLIEAFEETWPEVSWAMPWIVTEKSFDTQIYNFIDDTERKGRKGLLHHWIIVRPWDNFVIGLIGFDRITRSGKALWNLGYWIRSSEQQHGFARLSVESVLKWMAEGGPVCIELKVDPKRIACLVIEPVAGEGGFIPVGKAAMGQIRDFCDTYDIVMVADEVQTGFGRTGSLFSMEQFGIEPDLFTLAKSIAGGLPLSGVVGRSKIVDSAHIGGIGGTFGGNPVSCAAALAVLDIMKDERLPERAVQIGKKLTTKINAIKKDVPWIGAVKGLGAMQGISIIDKKGNPDKEHTLRIHKQALKNGLVMITAGTYGNIIRTLMPLVINDEELEESLEILCNALKTP